MRKGREGKGKKGKGKCPLCEGHHALPGCGAFKDQLLSERRSQVASLELCFNCCLPGHTAQECRSDKPCEECGARYHTLLHLLAVPVGNLQLGKTELCAPQLRAAQGQQCYCGCAGSSTPTRISRLRPMECSTQDPPIASAWCPCCQSWECKRPKEP